MCREASEIRFLLKSEQKITLKTVGLGNKEIGEKLFQEGGNLILEKEFLDGCAREGVIWHSRVNRILSALVPDDK